MLNKEIAALDEFFKAPWVRQEAVFPYWNRIKKDYEESCQLPTTKVKTPASTPTPDGEITPDFSDCKSFGLSMCKNIICSKICYVNPA